MMNNQKKAGDTEKTDALPNIDRTSLGEASASDGIPDPQDSGAIDRTMGSASMEADLLAVNTARSKRNETDQDPNLIPLSEEPTDLGYGGDAADQVSTPEMNTGTGASNTYMSRDTAVPSGGAGEGMGHAGTTAGGSGGLASGTSGTASGSGSTAGGAAGSAPKSDD